MYLTVPVVGVDQKAPLVIENLLDHLCSGFKDVHQSLLPFECIDEPPKGRANKPVAMFAFYFLLLLTVTTTKIAFNSL